MIGRQYDHDVMVGDAFPGQRGHVLAGGGRAQSHKTEVNLPRFQGAKLFGRGHVKQVDGDFRAGLIERGQRCRQEVEIELEQIAEVQLAGFAPAEPLDGFHAFET